MLGERKGPWRSLELPSSCNTHTEADTALPTGPQHTSCGWTDAAPELLQSVCLPITLRSPARGAAESLGANLVLRALPDTSSFRALGWSRETERQVLVNPASGNWLHDVYCKLQFSISIQVLSCLITYRTVQGGRKEVCVIFSSVPSSLGIGRVRGEKWSPAEGGKRKAWHCAWLPMPSLGQ